MSITLPTYSRLEIPLLGRRERLLAIIATGLRREVRRPAAIAITVLGAAFTTITSIILLFLSFLLPAGQGTGLRQSAGRDRRIPPDTAPAAVFLIAGLLVSAAFTYLMLFTEQTGALVLRRVWVRVQRQEWRRALEEIPCWLVSLALAAVFCGLLMLTVSQLPGELDKYRNISFTPLPLLGLLFLIRDAAIFLIFSLARAPRRVEATTLLYLALLYLILPGVCTLASADTLGALVLPPLFARPVQQRLLDEPVGTGAR